MAHNAGKYTLKALQEYLMCNKQNSLKNCSENEAVKKGLWDDLKRVLLRANELGIDLESVIDAEEGDNNGADISEFEYDNGFDYQCGVMDCFCEMVNAGLKQLALSHPCDTKKRRDMFLPYAEKLCRQYGIKMYIEDNAFLTDLFPVSLNKDKYNILFYRNDAVIEEYLRLKDEKEKLIKDGEYTSERRFNIAYGFGKLLSYTDEAIKRLIDDNDEKEFFN